MALTRKFLTALGIEPDKIDEIITAHAETVDALKAERDGYKVDAEALPGVKKELEDLKAATEKDGDDPYRVKYEAIKEEYDSYKEKIEAEKTKLAKRDAYRKLLVDAGIAEKRIESVLKVSDAEIEKLEIGADGSVKGAEEITKGIKTEWEDFIEKQDKRGADTKTPPNGSGGGSKMTKEEIMKIKDTAARQQAMKDNPELFGLV